MEVNSYFISKNSEVFQQLSKLYEEIETSIVHSSDFSFLERIVDFNIPDIYYIDNTFNELNKDSSKFYELQEQYQNTICYVQSTIEELVDFSSFPIKINAILYLFHPREITLQTLQCILNTANIIRASYKSSLRYRQIINEVTNLFTLINEKSEFIYSSPSMKHLHGYEEGELQGRSFINFIHPDDLPVVMGEFQKTLQSTSYNPRIEFRLKTKMGHYVTLEAQANNQLHNPDIRAIIVNSKDITEF